MPLYQLVTAPSSTFLSLSDAKTHLAVDWSDDDTYITSLVVAACEWIDGPYGALRRAILNQTWVYLTDDVAGGAAITVELPPFQSVSTVQYMVSGVYQTLTASNYTTRVTTNGVRVMPAYNKSWPAMDSDEQAIKIQFVAGYGSNANSVPDSIIHAAKLLVSHWYSNREAADADMKPIPFGIDALLAPYRAPVI